MLDIMEESRSAVDVTTYDCREREIHHEFTSTDDFHAKNEMPNLDGNYTVNNHDDFVDKESSGDVVLDVAYQIKEKLGVGLKAPLPMNGCVLNHENGLVKLDSGYNPGMPFNNVTVDKELEPFSPSSSDSSEDVVEISESADVGDRNWSKSKTFPCTGRPSLIINTNPSIRYIGYESELQMPDIMRLIQKDLSEPYSIYTYRYFIHNWPRLCFLAMDGAKCVGAVVCKLDLHKKIVRRGYIAMLAVDENYRKQKIGSNLVLKAIRAMVSDDADEVVLETEITNKPALRLYENLGFVRDKRLFRYYLNGVDALRLKLWLR